MTAPLPGPLSPEWPPSTDQLGEVASGLHWALEQLSYDLTHRPHITLDGRLPAIALDLTSFARLLRNHHDRPQP